MMFAELSALTKKIADYSNEIYVHSTNVSEIATQIAYHIGLPEKQIKLISNAGLLHDIGKITIHSKTLNKSGKLTIEEWLVIKKHPEIGVRILSSYSWAQPLFPLIYYHHERWDGKGYLGLSGQNAPLGARIISVADSFDAMMSSRPYQHSKTWEQALIELQRCSGCQFAPYLIDKILQTPEKILKLTSRDGVL